MATRMPVSRRGLQHGKQRLVVGDRRVLGDLDDDPLGVDARERLRDLRADQRLGRDVEVDREARGQGRGGGDGLAHGKQLERGAHAGFLGVGEPEVGRTPGLAHEARQGLDPGDLEIGEPVDRLEQDLRIALARPRRGSSRCLRARSRSSSMSAAIWFAISPEKVRMRSRSRSPSSWMGLVGRSSRRCRRRSRLRAVTGTLIWAPIGIEWVSGRARASGTVGGVGNELGQAALDDVLAIALRHRDDAADLDRGVGPRGVDAAENAAGAEEFGEERDIHAEVGADGLQHAVDVLDDARRDVRRRCILPFGAGAVHAKLLIRHRQPSPSETENTERAANAGAGKCVAPTEDSNRDQTTMR